ncbi:ankyrin repeat domain-containing protein [Wolbachia endosymbiont (group E) of Neria commutata]|uniref:ankyrin repeat domain-containing protein n=1 Tax=Wolbachia endosymbiont (group E) of Neria commutata TaxID=3066149 RepID=UPI003132B91E
MSQEQLDDQLIDAALEGNLDKVCNLLAAGANPNTLTTTFTAPLFIAADIGDAEMIRVMVKAGAKVNMRIDSYRDVHTFQFGSCSVLTRNQAPLHVAICKGRTDAVNALLKLGANVFTTCGSNKNKLALYLAVEVFQLNVAIREGRTDEVNALSKLGANEAVQCQKKREDTARDIAEVMIRQALSTFYHETKITLEDGQSVRFNSQITPSWTKDSELFKYWGNCRDKIREM